MSNTTKVYLGIRQLYDFYLTPNNISPDIKEIEIPEELYEEYKKKSEEWQKIQKQIFLIHHNRQIQNEKKNNKTEI